MSSSRERKRKSDSSGNERRQLAQSHTQKILLQQEEKKTNFRRFIGQQPTSLKSQSTPTILDASDNRSAEFAVNLTFANSLPRVPVGAVFVGGGAENQNGISGTKSFTEYRPTKLEAEHSWRLHTELDLGVKIDVISPSTFQVSTTENLAPGDNDIVNWKGHMGDSAGEALKKKRERQRRGIANGQHNSPASSKPAPAEFDVKLKAGKHFTESRVLEKKSQEYMRRTTYLANDIHQQVHTYKSLSEVTAEKVVELNERIAGQQEATCTEAIEKGFAYANRPNKTRTLQHPTKKKLTVEWVLPLLPDMERWNNSFLHTEIAPNDLSKTNNNNNSSAANNKIIKIKNINQSLIVDVEQTAQNDGVNNKKLTCNLVTPIDPRNEDEAKRSTYDVVSAYDAEFTPLRAQDEADTHFVLVVDEANGAVFYHPLTSKAQLSMPRKLKGRITRQVTRRPLTEEEVEEKEEALCEVDVALSAKRYGSKEIPIQVEKIKETVAVALDEDEDEKEDEDEDEKEDVEKEYEKEDEKEETVAVAVAVPAVDDDDMEFD